MSARHRGLQRLMSGGRSEGDRRLTELRDEGLHGVFREEDPVYWLDVAIVIGSMHRQMLIGQHRQMGVRHGRRVPVVCIAAMHVGERGLSEAEKQRSGGR